MTERAEIQAQVDQLKVGWCIAFPGRDFREAFPCGWPSIYETPEQSFLSKQVGSAWGAVTCEKHPYRDEYIVERRKEGNKRMYVDPDREHLYRKMPDGSYEFRG